jgi:hypothetical protein
MVITPGPADDGQHPARADPDDEKVPMLAAAEVAAIMGGKYTAGTVTRRYRHWGLTAYRVGKELRWKEAEVREWIDKRRVN